MRFNNTHLKSKRFRGYKIKIYPTESQKEIFNKTFNVYRYMYNWTLERISEYYNAYNKFIGILDLDSEFRIMRSNTEWIKEIPSHTSREAIRDAYDAYLNFFKHNAKFPKFKSKKRSKKSFRVRQESNAFYFHENGVKISGLPLNDYLLCKTHNIPVGENIKYYRCTISFDGYEYWLSLNVEKENKQINQELTDEVIGIDVGLRTFATLSDGTKFKSPDNHILINRTKRQSRRIRKMLNSRRNKSVQTRTKFENIEMSKNEIKLREKYHYTLKRIKDINDSFVHRVSNAIIAMKPKKIVIEDFSVRAMESSRHVAKLLAINPSLDKFRDQLIYKSIDNGIELVKANKYFPSTQLCSRCGSRYKPGTSETYRCPSCGLIIDRDINAAINLKLYADV